MIQETKEKIKLWLVIIFFGIPVVGFAIASLFLDLKGMAVDVIWLSVYTLMLIIAIDIWYKRKDHYGRLFLVQVVTLVLYYLWSHYTDHSVGVEVSPVTHFIILIISSVFYLCVVYNMFKTLMKI